MACAALRAGALCCRWSSAPGSSSCSQQGTMQRCACGISPRRPASPRSRYAAFDQERYSSNPWVSTTIFPMLQDENAAHKGCPLCSIPAVVCGSGNYMHLQCRETFHVNMLSCFCCAGSLQRGHLAEPGARREPAADRRPRQGCQFVGC